MLEIESFIEKNQINLKAVERIRHRMFVVGRFNQSKRGELNPDIYLFTNRPMADLPLNYLNNFTESTTGQKAHELRYESFVKCLRPALAEVIEFEGVTPESQIPKVKQLVPRDNDKAVEGSAVVDTFHYLFMRGTSTTIQPELINSRPRLPLGIDSVGENQNAGKGIFKLIRQNLHVFAKFQPRTHEIVESISALFEICARENGMPAYANGGALPSGFPEKLIDFVYAEDAGTQFDTTGLDFGTPPWNQLRDNSSRNMFEKVVAAFRNALLGVRIEAYGMDRFKGHALDYHARAVVSSGLKDDFINAREAYNGLRQVLRSKALISMVLEWVLGAYYNLPEVAGLPINATQAEKDEAVEKAILKSWDNNNKWINKRVAEPVARPTLEERDRFARELTANFEQLLLVLFADEASASLKINKLPKELQELANDLRSKPRYLEALAGIVSPTAGGDKDSRKAFIEACKVVLLDILCPTLFQQPILSLDMLQRYFEQETMAAYLTAVFLAKDNKGQVRDIAIDNLEYFQQKIDKKTQKIHDSEAIHKVLLGGFFDLIASNEIVRQMTEGLRVLREAHTILSNTPIGSAAGAISAVRPDPALQKSRVLDKTQLKTEEVNNSLHILVGKIVNSDERIQVKVAANSPKTVNAENTISQSGHGIGDIGGGTAHSSMEAKSDPSLATGETEIKAGATKAVKQVIDDFFKGRTESDAPIHKEEISALADAATNILIKDDGFMGKVRSDVRAFEQVLFLIYQRYNENTEKKTFRNRVERLTLINMMLLFQRELGLGTVSSNLYHMLIDLVQHMDPENPDPAAFIREKSLTVYFDNAKLETIGDLSGITNLRETLYAQAHENLRETVNFVSELLGIKYLMDRVKHDRLAEIIVINATATEFLNWLNADNIVAGQGKGGLRSGMLVNTTAERSVQPGLVYMTDAAFGAVGSAKDTFLSQLATIPLANGGLSFLMPPICISTPYQDSAGLWLADGRRWATISSKAAAPVVIVGPSAFLNDPKDTFKTYLSAGYIFGAHFLCHPEQRIEIQAVDGAPYGRLRQIGYGTLGMAKGLNRVLWPVDQNDRYAFSVDYYLYIILTLFATAARNPGEVPNADAFYSIFHRPDVGFDNWVKTKLINHALVGDNALKFSLSVEKGPLPSVNVNPNGGIEGRTPFAITDIAWFNVAREVASLL
jgi:hypothetical protein